MILDDLLDYPIFQDNTNKSFTTIFRTNTVILSIKYQIFLRR